MERNITLDYFKIFLATLVVNIHLPIGNDFPGVLNFINNDVFRNGISRIAVPCFFILNGYFLKFDDFSKVKNYIKHIVVIYIVWTLFYFPYEPTILNDFRAILTLLIGGCYHLWYLAALIPSTIILYILHKTIKKSIPLLSISLILFFLGYIIQYHYNSVWTDVLKSRNFLFMGIPFITIGYLMKKNMNLNISKNKITLFTVLSFIIFSLEIFATLKFKQPTNYDFYISLFFFCPLLLLTLFRYSTYKKDDNRILGSLSSAIYLSHFFIIFLAQRIFPTNTILYPFVLIMTILFSFLIIYANKSLKIFL